MSMPLNFLERMWSVSQRDLPSVEQYLHRRGELVRKGMAPESAPIEHRFRYSHARRDWFCILKVEATRIEFTAVLFWLHYPRGVASESLGVIQPRSDGRSLYFDTHFFSRWGMRNDELRVKVTNMQSFFRQHPRIRMIDLGKFKHGRRAFAAALGSGLVHGAWLGNKMISCDTFIHTNMMRPEELSIWRRLYDAG